MLSLRKNKICHWFGTHILELKMNIKNVSLWECIYWFIVTIQTRIYALCDRRPRNHTIFERFYHKQDLIFQIVSITSRIIMNVVYGHGGKKRWREAKFGERKKEQNRWAQFAYMFYNFIKFYFFENAWFWEKNLVFFITLFNLNLKKIPFCFKDSINSDNHRVYISHRYFDFFNLKYISNFSYRPFHWEIAK